MPLTNTKLRIVRATGVRFDLPDRQGLALQVGVSGPMTWTLTYRVVEIGTTGEGRVARRAGTKQRMNLNEYPAVGLSEARTRALAARELARAGSDPAEARRAALAPTDRPPTVADLVERYAEGHLRARNLRAGPNVERLLRRHVAPA